MANLSNSNISAGNEVQASDVKQCVDCLTGDTVYDNVKIDNVAEYEALLRHSYTDPGLNGGHSTSVIQTFKNNLGVSVTWARNGANDYRLTFTGCAESKTQVQVHLSSLNIAQVYVTVNSGYIQFIPIDFTGSSEDQESFDIRISIRQFP